MFSSLVAFKKALRPMDHDDDDLENDDGHLSPTSRPVPTHSHHAGPRYATADFTEADDDDEDSHFGHGHRRHPAEDNNPIEDEDGIHDQASLLPLFSASHLDSIPVYTLTHAIRILVQARTETTLTWDQLRSPQVSQFLMKPMQQQIRTQHFSRATLYALMANSLQFAKEGQIYPGNAGTCGTRAKVCELLAIKLLKEYSTRELIDTLSYDFYPLQGMPALPVTPTTRKNQATRLQAARTSTLEVAIRASAKRFLSHPLVVQHLEAIWNGAVSFYSSADSLHRQEEESQSSYRQGTQGQNRPNRPDVRTPLLAVPQQQPWKEQTPSTQDALLRRTVTLYDPRNASLFKLSRLRVPRYRQFLSTLSLAILIGLFLSVLATRSTRITGLELIFWFWSAGFMLDELVGFTEQGFSLYIMSFWNIFDLGILLLLIIYYCMRAYALFLLDPYLWNEMAYDVLAANAILLLPRIFSVLDHYQYFSQLLIAFRLMAVDLAAVLVLVLISCSGFFVFFTLSRTQGDAGVIAYKIFQILMGFSPAAWGLWAEYDWLGKILLALFLIMCHFVVVTILITVLTNSFMAIASNATQEHQFLFAINTISMVKNDALFSYVAPSNIFAWLLLPLRYCMPLRQFVWLNRGVIKLTHFPLLFCIYFYERFWLAPAMYDATDLVEHPGRGRPRNLSIADPANRTVLFSPNIRVREESVVGFQKDRALEEVFRRAPENIKSQRQKERRKTQTAIRNWMDQADDGSAGPRNWPTIDSRLAPDNRGYNNSIRREPPTRRRRQVSDVRSTASDPADLMSNVGFTRPRFRLPIEEERPDSQYRDHTDADGDDELVTNDEDEEEDNVTMASHSQAATNKRRTQDEGDYYETPVTSRFNKQGGSGSGSLRSSVGKSAVTPRAGPSNARRTLHSRTMSTNTILYNPKEVKQPLGHSTTDDDDDDDDTHSEDLMATAKPKSRLVSSRNTGNRGGIDTPTTIGPQSPRRAIYMASRPRPIEAPRNNMARTAPHRPLSIDTQMQQQQREQQHRGGPSRRLSSVDMDITSDMGLEDPNNPFGAVPSSFATQMALATGFIQSGRGGHGGKDRSGDGSGSDRMSRLVLARMKTLEEGFADVVREMRVLRSGVPTAANSEDSDGDAGKVKESAGGSVGGPRKMGGISKGLKVTGKRPGVRRSKTEERVQLHRRGGSKGKGKGKGKEVLRSDGEGLGTGDDGMGRASLPLKGGSL